MKSYIVLRDPRYRIVVKFTNASFEIAKLCVIRLNELNAQRRAAAKERKAQEAAAAAAAKEAEENGDTALAAALREPGKEEPKPVLKRSTSQKSEASPIFTRSRSLKLEHDVEVAFARSDSKKHFY